MTTKEEQFVLRWMMHLGNEVEYIGTSPLQAKFKIMLLMVYVDIFSQVWDLVIENNANQRERFNKWSDEFIFSETNKFFVSHRDEFYGLNGELLYKVRNSLLHFGGLPSMEVPIFITNADGRLQFCRKYSRQIEEQEPLVLCSRDIFITVSYAIANMLEKISEIEESNSKKYKEIMLELYDRVRNEMALPID